jgi:hypothetical protein
MSNDINQIVSEKLDKNNFHAWKFRMTNFLMGKGFWDYVEGGNEDPPELPEENATAVEIKAFKDWNQGACKQGHVLVVCQCYRHYDWAHTGCSHSSRSMAKLGANVPDKYKGKEVVAKAKVAHYGEEEHVYQ